MTATLAKHCTQCDNTYPATAEYFTRSRNRAFGLYSYCRTCRAANDAEYRKTNAATLAQRKRARRLENHDATLEKERVVRAERREVFIEIKRRYYAKNRNVIKQKWLAIRDVENEKRRVWRSMNRDAVLARKRLSGVAHKQNRRARKKGLPDAFSSADWQRALDCFGGCCAVCGRPAGLFHTLAADHWVALSSPQCPGTIPTNIVPLCHGINGCNNAKSSRDAIEWLVCEYGVGKGKAIAGRIQAYFDSWGGAV